MAKRSRVQKIENTMLRIYAQAGANARLDEIRHEMESIYRTFPALRSGGTASRSEVHVSPPGAREVQRPRKRRKLTAAERKAIGLRMKKYWAERRKARAAK